MLEPGGAFCSGIDTLYEYQFCCFALYFLQRVVVTSIVAICVSRSATTPSGVYTQARTSLREGVGWITVSATLTVIFFEATSGESLYAQHTET